MRGITVFVLVLLAFVQPTFSSEQKDESDETPKRLGKKKKKVQGGKVYASYGLSPHKGAPKRVVEYSKAAVKIASSASSSTTTNKKTTTGAGQRQQQGQALPAPGCQAKVDFRPYMSAVEDQSQSNSCAANAVAGAYEYLATRAALRDGEEDVGEISRLFIYYVGRKRDQLNWGENIYKRPRDEGMTLKGAIEAVQMKGAALQSSWPFDLDRVNHKPGSEAFEEAMRYKVGDAMAIPLNLDKMRQCLSDGYPIVFGLKLTQSFFAPSYDGFIATPDPSDPKSAEHGLHAMLIVGYNDRQRVFVVRNSWGSDWGVAGYCYLPYDYVCNPDFNFVGMYAIQSLTDDDLTPDEDDGQDLQKAADPSNTTPFVELEDVEDEFLMALEDEDDDDDVGEMFDSRAEALRAFVKLAGDHSEMSSENLLLDKQELKAALLLFGVPMVTDEEITAAFRLYDDDGSGFINFDEFLDMQELFDGSLLERRRWRKRMETEIRSWAKKSWGWFSSSKNEAQPSEL
mmetsp:Transcript_25652/g.42679  ORF Transcript_25652/g.42679 Transcript_25652/m.42679 type:complete len:512 (-) Transcript_25652:39-1574(-)|eukprot:CAMPEP_0119016302 /NCGR_PEP_ID=MMETSP1176-20130426/11921_1 /TAXON_ID=265551 /ORGANISM="Synedropsis recta cf, Strain CCMP1620" /LENGTH=511 /DNA_ID=CAMNT_0006969645 /DNA_START=131 /DNA_END=1666 /DNA_ORIENTATION=-